MSSTFTGGLSTKLALNIAKGCISKINWLNVNDRLLVNDLLRAIFRENRKSQDTREKIEFFFSFAKTSLLVP